MSWSFSVNGTLQDYELSPDLIESMQAVDPEYPHDMRLALGLAKMAGLKSATVSGFRTPNPYGGPETIGYSVMGTIEPDNWQETVKANIAHGPDDAATEREYQRHLAAASDDS